MPLESPDQQHLKAAQGYIELGMFLEANEELESIDPYCKALPEVSEVRLKLFEKMGKWELMEVVAQHLANECPENPEWWIAYAYAARRQTSIQEAAGILEKALQVHPGHPIVHYNLACYDCQQGDLVAAKNHLRRAFQLEPKCRLMALDDEDLEPLWHSLSTEVK